MRIETLLSQEDFFQESQFHKNDKEKYLNIEFGFFENTFLDIEQNFLMNYNEKIENNEYSEIQNKENITPQLSIKKGKTQTQELSVINEENQSHFQQSQQNIKNSTEIFQENFEKIYHQYDEEQEFLFSENDSKDDEQSQISDEQKNNITIQSSQNLEITQQLDSNKKQKCTPEKEKHMEDSWQDFQQQKNQQFKNVRITKISSSEKNSLCIQDQQIQSRSSIQNTLMSNQSLDEENSFIKIEKEVQNKNCFKKQFTITEIQDEQINKIVPVIPEEQDKSPIKEKTKLDDVSQNDCAIFEIIKNSLLESKKPKNFNSQFSEQQKESECNIEKISINLDEDSIVTKDQTLNKQKKQRSIKKTIQRLLQKGEEYKSTLRKKTQEKRKQELQECSFTPKINQKKFNFNKKEQGSFVISSKNLEILNKSRVSCKSQTRSVSNIQRNYNNKNFIKENIKKLRNEKFGTKSDIRQNPVKIIKFEEPTFQPTINRKSSILAAKRKNSISTVQQQRNRSHSVIEKPKKFKASDKSEKIIQKKILDKFYSVLIELDILKEIEDDYGDISISKIQLFQICLSMKYFKINQKKFSRVSFKKKQFFENMFRKNLIPQEVYDLLTVMWDFLSDDDKIIYIRDLAFFILAIHGISIENEGECVFDRKTILKIQASFKTFKQNSMRKEKIKSNKNLQSSNIQPIKSNKIKNSELASNYRSKLLDKYTDYITQGLLPMPKKQYLDHVDFLSLKEQIREVELNKKRQINRQNSLNECTFQPLVNSQISHKTLQPYRLTEDFYESTKSVLKLEIKINGKNNETLFLCSEEDIQKEVTRAQKKYVLKDKQVKKLYKVITKQWKNYISDK